MIEKHVIEHYFCDECKKELEKNEFGEMRVDLGSSNDITYTAIININTIMSYRGSVKDICNECKLKILKRAVNVLEREMKEKE